LRHQTQWEPDLKNSGGHHQRLRQRNPYRSSHELQEHAHSTLVVESLKAPDKISEGTGSDLDDLAVVQSIVKMHGSIFVGSKHQVLDQSVGHRLWLSAAHQQALDAQGSIDAPPTVPRPIKDGKKVSREEGGRDGLHPPGMPPILEVQGQKGAIALVGKLLNRVPLTLR
jgi:hypothetical protein